MLRIIVLFLFAHNLQAQEAPVSFNQALEEMLEGHIKKQQADLTQTVANARIEHAEAAFFPSLQTQTSLTSQPIDGKNVTASGISIRSSVNLYRFGGDLLHYESALAMKESDEYTRVEIKSAAEEESARALLALIAARREFDLTNRSVESRVMQHHIVEKLFKSGLRPLEDVQKMEIDVSAEENRLRNNKIKLVKAEGDIEAIIGKKIQIPNKWPWGKHFSQSKTQIFQTTESSVCEKNRAYLAIKARLVAAKKNLQETDSKYFPSIDLNVSWENSRYSKHNSPQANNPQWGGALVLTIPLWDKLNTKTQLSEQLHNNQILSLDLIATERRIKSDWRVVKESFLTSLENMDASEKILGSARQLYEHSQKSFQSGLLSTNELDLEQARLLEAEMNVLQTQYATHLAFLQLTRNQGESLTTK